VCNGRWRPRSASLSCVNEHPSHCPHRAPSPSPPLHTPPPPSCSLVFPVDVAGGFPGAPCVSCTCKKVECVAECQHRGSAKGRGKKKKAPLSPSLNIRGARLTGTAGDKQDLRWLFLGQVIDIDLTLAPHPLCFPAPRCDSCCLFRSGHAQSLPSEGLCASDNAPSPVMHEALFRVAAAVMAVAT
jgi:hypothetical protein